MLVRLLPRAELAEVENVAEGVVDERAVGCREGPDQHPEKAAFQRFNTTCPDHRRQRKAGFLPPTEHHITETWRVQEKGSTRHHCHHHIGSVVVLPGRDDADGSTLALAPVCIREGNVGDLPAFHELRATPRIGLVVDRVLGREPVGYKRRWGRPTRTHPAEKLLSKSP